MNREERIRERTRDLLNEIARPELHPVNLDPYPATVSEVADEIARVVLDLDASGAARGLAAEVRGRLDARTVTRIGNPYLTRPPAVKVCRRGEHRDGRDTATARVRYLRNGQQRWTVDMCDRHAAIVADNMTRGGWRGVEIMPAGWTPECTHGADCQVHRDANGPHSYDWRNLR